MSTKQITYPTVYGDAISSLEPKIKVLQIVINNTMRDRLMRHVQSFRRRIASVKDAVLYTVKQLRAAERLVDEVSELEKVVSPLGVSTYRIDIRNWNPPFRVDVSYSIENGTETIRNLKFSYKRNDHCVTSVDVVNTNGDAADQIIEVEHRIDALEEKINSIVPGSTKINAVNGIFRELSGLGTDVSRSENILGMLVDYAENWMESKVDNNYARFLYNDPAIA